MDGAIKVYAYAPGRVFSVGAAPLHVTTLTLEPGETLIDKAAGDTVRWEIGDTTSGAGDTARTLVMLKPLTSGLATNMVLTTSRRVYLLDLTSSTHKVDTAVAWSYPTTVAPVRSPVAVRGAPPEPVALGVVSARYAITPLGRRPGWTPQAVFDDGQRTFIAFGPTLAEHDAPLLFVTGPDGRSALVNYRQAGDLYIVDKVFSRAELRLGDRRPEIVRLAKLDAEAAP